MSDVEDALNCIETNKMPTRQQSEAVWRAIKEGLLTDTDALRWLSFVATAVVADVIDGPPRGKHDGAIKALKFDPNEGVDEDEIPKEELELFYNAENALRQLFTSGEPKKMPLRAQSDAIWRAIAARAICDESIAKWACWVAKDIVANVIDSERSDKEKSRRAQKAIKISGKAAPEIDESIKQAAFWLRINNSASKIKSGLTFFGYFTPPPYVSPYKWAKEQKAKGFYKDLSFSALKSLMYRITK